MTRPSPMEIERWRATLAADTTVSGRGDCPPAEILWASVAGDAAPATEDILDHVFACGACSAAWRAAHELQSADACAPASPRRFPVSLLWAAAAAVFLAVVSVPFLLVRWTSEPPVYRAAEGVEIVATCAGFLPREEFVLAWEGAPEGSSYDVRVMTAGLVTLKEAFGIRTPRLHVPPAALSKLAKGDPVLWQVTSRLPDGQRVVSVTFTTRLQ